MDFRPLGTTLVGVNKRRGSTTSTVIPNPVLHLLGARTSRLAEWVGSGSHYQLRTGDVDGSTARRIQRYTGRVTIPNDVARRLGTGDGDALDWRAGYDASRGWEVHVYPAGRAIRPMLRMDGGRVASRRPIATGTVKEFKGRRYSHPPTLAIPRVALRVLGTGDLSHARWEVSGRFASLLPATDEDGGRVSSKRYNTGKRTYRSSYLARLPGRVAKTLVRGGDPGITWYLATDGRGGWDVQAASSSVKIGKGI